MSDTITRAQKHTQTHTPRCTRLHSHRETVLTRHGDVWHNRASIHVRTHSSVTCHKTLAAFSGTFAPGINIRMIVAEECTDPWQLHSSPGAPLSLRLCSPERFKSVFFRFRLHQTQMQPRPYTSGNRDGDRSLRSGLEMHLSHHTQRLETWLKLKKTQLGLAIWDSWTIFVSTLARLLPSPLLISPSLQFHECEAVAVDVCCSNNRAQNNTMSCRAVWHHLWLEGTKQKKMRQGQSLQNQNKAP